MLYSLMKNNGHRDMKLYLLGKNISEVFVQRVERIARGYTDIEILVINCTVYSKATGTEELATIDYLKMLPDIDKALWIENCCVVTGDISELYDADISNAPMAVCYDSNAIVNGIDDYLKNKCRAQGSRHYINEGIVLWNLKYIKENNIVEIVEACMRERNGQYEYLSQDVLNELFWDKAQIVPWELYNLAPCCYMLDLNTIPYGEISYMSYQDIFSPKVKNNDKDYKDITDIIIRNSRILHFVGGSKPWINNEAEEFWAFKPYRHIWVGYENEYNQLIKDRIVVKDNFYTLQWVKNNRCSVARFGDGEFDIMAGHSIPYQDYNAELADKMRQIVSSQSDKSYIVCLPDVFERLERYNAPCVSFWKGHLSRYSDLYKAICVADWYGSTFFSRPYIDYIDKSFAAEYFGQLKDLWKDEDLLIVEGVTSRSGVGNDLFDAATSIQRVICPSRNAYERIDEIEDAIRRFGKGKLVLVMLGPTAKIISNDLGKTGYWIVDMGHIDTEYEWYKMGAVTKVKLSNKHTAEHNFDENIIMEYDDQYEQQIVYRLE